MRKLFLTSLTCLLSTFFYCQIEIADAMYDNFEYNGAIKYYNLADSLTVDSREKLAFSYLNVKDFKGFPLHKFFLLTKTVPLVDFV